jgi:hypothetical protein
MTMLWSEWELDAETDRTAYFPPPARLVSVEVEKPAVTEHGHAEVKPHHYNGLNQGIDQLRGSSGVGSRFLITYRPEGGGNPTRPRNMHLYMTDFHDTTPGQLRQRRWWDLGTIPTPRYTSVDWSNKSLVGQAMEKVTRNMFNNKFLKPQGRTMRHGTGGNLPGSDIRWELEEFYRELGRQLCDPFYAELASELASLR